MKRLLLAFGLLLSLNVFSATIGTLNLVGTIPKKVEIVVTPKPSASTLALETTQTNLSVATLTGKSNSNVGYTITIASSNAGKLVNSIASPVLSTEVSYTMKVDSTSVALASSTSLSFTGKTPFTKDVTVSYTGVDASLYEEGSYTDTVTFTIAAN